MSALPLVLEGTGLRVLVVGGGRVATRKVTALLQTGAMVHVVAPTVSDEIEALAAAHVSLRITRAQYETGMIGDALLVIAATDDETTNATIAADARAANRLVNVVSAPDLGNCVTPAVHRAGDLVVSVSAGRLPGAAARVRDAIARTLDERYARAVRELTILRRALLDNGLRDRWADATAALLGPSFCDDVESGHFSAKVAQWH